jgi:hypothetical protein
MAALLLSAVWCLGVPVAAAREHGGSPEPPSTKKRCRRPHILQRRRSDVLRVPGGRARRRDGAAPARVPAPVPRRVHRRLAALKLEFCLLYFSK